MSYLEMCQNLEQITKLSLANAMFDHDASSYNEIRLGELSLWEDALTLAEKYNANGELKQAEKVFKLCRDHIKQAKIYMMDVRISDGKVDQSKDQAKEIQQF